ncbi:hypothetical protein [Ancylobacter pratisalsi]|uniref:Uncharacterized protein n=1 Tax=Ancylobacter pratisalsi TaxID=1745854 RepID=A0A6P1YTT6_9HYPH|nr:hypothetical protein [Ancylobacter pratisalsi]QIB36542.1 hypothetical protein G3A50_22260 [Ancylobacter pratisalsi]
MFLDTAYGGPAPSPRRDHHAMRADLTDIIERAIAALDALEGDPDLEAAGDYLDASYPEWSGAPPVLNDGRGMPFEDAEESGDLEPSLGAPEAGLGGARYCSGIGPVVASGEPQRSQLHWADGGQDEREDEHDGAEPDSDGEMDDFREDDDPEEDSDPHGGADDDDNGVADDGGC